MKFYCKNDAIHFVQDFELTLKPPCNFWGDLGMSNLQIELKKKLWDWIFACPTDEIGILSNIAVSIQIEGIPIPDETKFENVVPGYKDLTEIEQQEYQRKYFKLKRTNPNAIPPRIPKKEKLIN